MSNRKKSVGFVAKSNLVFKILFWILIVFFTIAIFIFIRRYTTQFQTIFSTETQNHMSEIAQQVTLTMNDRMSANQKNAETLAVAVAELGTVVRGEFFEGNITNQDIESVVRQDKKIYRTEVTGQQLWEIIEQGVIEANSSWFITVSGMKYSYTSAKEEVPGKLLTLELMDGTPVDREQTYMVAVSENQMMEVPGMINFFGMPSEEVGITLREAMVQNIQKQGEISPLLDGRITVMKE